METIRLGDKGADVESWQKVLGVTADGDFGPKTDAATKAWQKVHGLSPDGVVGPKSWAASAAVITAATSEYVEGLDVAWPQGVIDWDKVPEKYKLVFVQMSNGISGRDPSGPPNLLGARRTNRYAAVYHFFQANQDAVAQIANLRGAIDVATALKTIRSGAAGYCVEIWQKFLGVSVTGKFDAATDAATRVFQGAKGLVVDGIVGPRSWDTAQFVAEHIKPACVALDFETLPKGTTPAQAVAVLRIAVSEVQKVFPGVKIAIYTYPNFALQVIGQAFALATDLADSCFLWIADYSKGEAVNGKTPWIVLPFKTWMAWQSSGNSSSFVPGIMGHVDHDVFHGSEEELRAFLNLDQ